MVYRIAGTVWYEYESTTMRCASPNSRYVRLMGPASPCTLHGNPSMAYGRMAASNLACLPMPMLEFERHHLASGKSEVKMLAMR